MTKDEVMRALANTDDEEEVRHILADFVSDWLIAVATMENGDLVTDLEAQWSEEMTP